MSNVISFTAAVINEEGERTVLSTNSYDIYRAEKALGKLELLQGNVKFEELAHVIFSAAQRNGIAGDDFDAWLREVELDLDPEDADPKG